MTNPVYLGWWLVDGQVVHTENHPAIIDEEIFLLAQETLTRHGRGAQRARGGRGRPLLLSGLLWCGRHDVRVRMGSHASQTQRRYQCDESYDAGRTGHHRTIVEARALDEPSTDVVLRRCGFAEQAEAVVAQIQAEYDTAREDARRRRRELTQLQHEVETLQANLAQARAPAHVAMIFEQIDRRRERIARWRMRASVLWVASSPRRRSTP